MMAENLTEDDMFTAEGSFPYAGSDRGTNVPQSPKALSHWRQQRVLAFLESSGQAGATAKETVQHLIVSGEPNAHHGNASGALSAMHKDGRISRLARKRNRYHVYVLNEHVAGRETQAHGSASKKGDEVLGIRRKVVVDTTAADEIARLKEQVREANALTDKALADKERYATRNDELLDTAGKLSGQIGILRSERDNLEADREEAIRQAEMAKAASSRPRKTITADERALLVKLSSMLAKKSDGPADRPNVIPTRVSALRMLASALARVTGDD
jgi:hypothetical protein